MIAGMKKKHLRSGLMNVDSDNHHMPNALCTIKVRNTSGVMLKSKIGMRRLRSLG
jgi:hypothetical protein